MLLINLLEGVLMKIANLFKATTLVALFAIVMAPAVQSGIMPTSTDKFVKKAAISNQFEIDSSKLALERSQNAEVRKLAQQMIDDHTKAGADFKAALVAGKVDQALVPTGLDKKHQRIMENLREEDAEDFDDEYVDAQERAHRKAVNLFEDYAKDGDNAALKDFAAKTLPTLKQHKDHVDKVEGAID